MDRRGFLRNIVGSLAAASLPIPIPAAKPLASKPIEFKCVDLVGDVYVTPELLADDCLKIDQLLQKLFSRSIKQKMKQAEIDFFVHGVGVPRIEREIQG
jgi:hypothetical protein